MTQHDVEQPRGGVSDSAEGEGVSEPEVHTEACLLYTSDAADDTR